MEIKLLVENDTNLYNSTYYAYVTHDKGSSMVSKDITPAKKDLIEEIAEFYKEYISPYYLAVAIIVTILSFILGYVNKKVK
jgi:hypothetical protein